MLCKTALRAPAFLPVPNNGEKIAVIKANADKYSISGMCRLLGVTRSLVYYIPTPHKPDVELENAVIEEFNANRKVYGRRKLKRALKRRETPLVASPRRIGKIMDKYGLVSKYVLRHKKRKTNDTNEGNKPNLVDRKFDNRKPLEVIVSDLTYVKVCNCKRPDLCESVR